MLGLFLTLCLLFASPASAAFVASSLAASGVNPTQTTATVTLSATPTANALVLACVTDEMASTGPASPVTMSGTGLTWVEVGNVLVNGNLMRVTLFRAMGASPSGTSATITLTTPAGINHNVTWAVGQITGTDTSGTNGSGAIVQSNTFSGTVQTAPSVTLSAFSDTANGTYGCFGGITGANSFTEGSGFTAIGQASGFGSRAFHEFQAANDTGVDATCTSQTVGALAAEIKTGTPTPPPTRRRQAPRYYNYLFGPSVDLKYVGY